MKGQGQEGASPAPTGPARKAQGPGTPGGVDATEAVQHDFEAFGLNGYEARVLVAVLRLGSAGAAQLARASGVHRTSVYPVLQELAAKGLVKALPGKTAMWSSPGADEVLERLLAFQEERVRGLKSRMETTREALERILPDDDSVQVPHLQLIQGSAHVHRAYDQLVANARSELLVFNRPPYSYDAAAVNPVVMDALRRGVATRVLYEAAQVGRPEAEPFRQAMATYHAAGAQGRVVDELPLKLAVADRRVVLLAMADTVQPEVGFPTNVLVDHEGFAEVQADAFDLRWSRGRPFPATRPRTRRAAGGPSKIG